MDYDQYRTEENRWEIPESFVDEMLTQWEEEENDGSSEESEGETSEEELPM